MSLNASIGSRIAKLRKEHRLTQEQFAEKLDISIKHCSAVERGLSCLSLEKLIEVSNLFDVSLDYLIKGKTSISDYAIDYTIDYESSDLPSSILSIISSRNESEINLLQEYLRLYTKIRNAKKED